MEILFLIFFFIIFKNINIIYLLLMIELSIILFLFFLVNFNFLNLIILLTFLILSSLVLFMFTMNTFRESNIKNIKIFKF